MGFGVWGLGFRVASGLRALGALGLFAGFWGLAHKLRLDGFPVLYSVSEMRNSLLSEFKFHERSDRLSHPCFLHCKVASNPETSSAGKLKKTS